MRVVLCGLLALVAACSADASRNTGDRCTVPDDCTSYNCYRGFCINDGPLDASTDLSVADLGETPDDGTMHDDAGDDAGGDVDAGDVDAGEQDAGEVDGGPTCGTCPGSFPDCCGGGCTNLMNDSTNCGMCGHPCVGGVCGMGLCCTPPMVPCGGTCVTLGDNTNCASCGDRCMGGTTCCHHGGGGMSCTAIICT